jgi:hypothetical protein
MRMNDSDQSTQTDRDVEFARQTYYDLLTKGSAALEEMMEVAKATEHPRAFEVLSGLMKNVADINGNLIDLHKKKRDIDKTDKPLTQLPGTTNNNVFVGSTSELQKMLLKPIEHDDDAEQ